MSKDRQPSRRGFLAGAGGFMASGLWLNAAQADTPVPPDDPLFASWTHQTLEADVVVAGGGLAGVCAAIAAARGGARVVLIQDRSRLGGNGSSEIRMHVLGASSLKGNPLWRETGIIEELKLTEAALNPQRSFEMWDMVLYDKVVSEPNITLLLDTAVVGAAVEGGRVARVTAASALLEERYTLSAGFFLD